MKPAALCLTLAAFALAGCATGPRTAATGNQDLDLTTRLKLAAVAANTGNEATALNIYAAAAEANPHDPKAQIAYAKALTRADHIAEARNVLLKAEAGSPAVRAYPREVAVIDALSGDTPRAIREFDVLLASDPTDWKTLIDKGVAFDLEGRHDDAQALYRKAEPLSHGAAAVATDYAMSLMLQGRFQEARAKLEPYFNSYDAPARTRNDLAIAYATTGKPQRTKQLVPSQAEAEQVDNLAAALVARAKPSS